MILTWIVRLLLYCSLCHISSQVLHQKRSMLSEDPCLDNSLLGDVMSIDTPLRYDLPIANSDSAKVYVSHGLEYQWSWLKSLPIRGLSPITTVDDIIRWLDSSNCSFLATGQSIWQSVLRQKPVLVQAETGCTIQKVYSRCLRKFGALSCGLYPLENQGWGAHRLEIGDARANTSIDQVRAQPLQLFELGTSPSGHFTADELVIYDDLVGHTYLVDGSGRGLWDTCEKRISITRNDTHWRTFIQDVPSALKYYEMRWLGFSGNDELRDHANAVLEKKFDKKEIQTFYCESLLGGVVSWAGEMLTTACHLVYPSVPHVRLISSAQAIMTEEMGIIWSRLAGPSIDEMEAVYVTAKVFTDVRNRMKHRVHGEVKPLPPSNGALLEKGKPLAGDISEVHQRPILSQSSALSKLPRDFPSRNSLHPDENGTISEQWPIEGAGGGHELEPSAYDEDDDDSSDADDDQSSDYRSDAAAQQDVPSPQGQDAINKRSTDQLSSMTCLVVLIVTLLYW